MHSGESGINPVAMTITNPWREYWPSLGSNQRPPVLKSAVLPTELWGLATNFLTSWTNFKASADDRFKIDEIMISAFKRVRNIVEKEGNDPFSHNVFKDFFLRVIKSQDCVVNHLCIYKWYIDLVSLCIVQI